jgi:RNA polymerase sigma factor (TIGR02999 family)
MRDDQSPGDAPIDDTAARFPGLREALQEIAERLLSGEIVGHTLQPTAMAHEAWFKLAGPWAPRSVERARFLALAAHAMRQVLVDHARGRRLLEGDAPAVALTIADDRLGFEISIDDLMVVDTTLTDLAEEYPRLVRVVELRFFAGLSEDETARTLDVSTRTVQRDWAKARTRLQAELDKVNGSN